MKITPRYIFLTKGYVARVDWHRYDACAALSWRAVVQSNGLVYAGTVKPGTRASTLRMHRFITGVEKSVVVVDHRNGDTLDNTDDNLRRTYVRFNNRNKRIRKDNVTGVTGVCFDNTRKKWRASIAGEHIGFFETLELANGARRYAAWEKFGKYERAQ